MRTVTERVQFGNTEEERTSAVGSRYQITGEETADREDSVGPIVNGRVCELATAP
jgi:hypothetical protein